MSERLRQLQRQQALLREHLAWIEGEIAREKPPGSNAATLPTIHTPPARPGLNPESATTPTDGDADALLERYAASERQNPRSIRLGCLLIFFGTLGLLALIVGVAWWSYYR